MASYNSNSNCKIFSIQLVQFYKFVYPYFFNNFRPASIFSCPHTESIHVGHPIYMYFPIMNTYKLNDKFIVVKV